MIENELQTMENHEKLWKIMKKHRGEGTWAGSLPGSLLPHGLRLTDAPQLVRSVVKYYARRVMYIKTNFNKGAGLKNYTFS